jgi:hypothetical protein
MVKCVYGVDNQIFKIKYIVIKVLETNEIRWITTSKGHQDEHKLRLHILLHTVERHLVMLKVWNLVDN